MSNLPPGGLLAWDLARTSGFCYGLVGDLNPTFGIVRLTDTYADARYVAFQDRFADMLERMMPGKVVIEAPLPLPAHTTLQTTSQQLTLRSLARMECWRVSVPVFEGDVATVRRDVLGRSYFAKDTVKREVVRFCLKRGWKVTDHNAGDACLLWLWYVRDLLGIRPAAGPLFAEMAA